jgi:mannose-6-phosphate isomerase-like protein (cupin superfamily)
MDNLAKQILKDVALEEIAPRIRKKSPIDQIDHWSPAILLERAAYLKKMARYGDGSATETLREYPQHIALLSFRSRDSEAEMYQDFAVVFFALAGAATLVTGGALTNARSVEPGLSRGASIGGGTRQDLRAGEIAHVPAGLPHQILVAGEKTITCFVIKIQEAV